MEVLSNNERSFIQQAAAKGLRIDGRGLFDFRQLKINFLQKRGHVEVALGNSLVFCAPEIEIDSPFTDRPNEGFLTFNVNFLPMAHPNFEQVLGYNLSQRHRRCKNEISQEIERLLEKTIKRSRALNTESLCIVSGKFAWHVSINLHILANHGNLLDLSVQAVVLSLMHARVPDIKINPDRTIEPLNVWKPLSLHFLPICISFGFLKGEITVLDPEIKEESILEGKVLVCMNVYGDILALQKSGPCGLDQNIIFQCLDIALIKTKQVTKQLREVAEAHKEFDCDNEKVQIRAKKLLEDIGVA